MIGLTLLITAESADARDCAAPEESVACATNDECGCGVNGLDGACAVAARECVGAGDCDRFCDGIFASLTAVCRGGRCARARLIECAGDCDADAAVGIAELMIGVGIALDAHPIAACSNLDRDRDGAVGISELVRAVRAALDGCAAAGERSADLRGTYDAVLTTRGEVARASAQVYDNDGGLAFSIAQGPNRSIYLSGPLVGDHLTLTGAYIVTDIGYSLTGEATVVTGEDEEIISGTMASEPMSLPPSPDAFVLRRGAAENAARFSGSYRLHFSESPRGNGQPSSATVRLEVAGDGFAFSSEGDDRGAGGALYGTLTTGTCSVAPGGDLSCSMVYLLADSQLSTPLRLTGALAPIGGGAFLSGYDPPFGPEPYVAGTWSAD